MVLTHVDVIPTQLEPGTAKVKAFVEAGRAAPGNLRFDDVVQANRKNHFTVIEAWKSQGRQERVDFGARRRAPSARNLQPIGGALYDERRLPGSALMPPAFFLTVSDHGGKVVSCRQ